jgi:glyoxylase-like metal-dependent hydrolase (beta-lactamase superfamily II)
VTPAAALILIIIFAAMLSFDGGHALASTPLQEVPMNGSGPVLESDALRIHRLSMGPSNAFLIETDEGVTLVDAGLPTSTRSILNTLAEIGRRDDLCTIYITHAHIDHFGAADEVRERTGASVLIHEADAEALSNGETRLGMVRTWGWTRMMLPWLEPLTSIRDTPPDATVVDGQRLTGCGLESLQARVLHTPGHTPGSSTLMITDPSTGLLYAFAGDLISTLSGNHVQSSYADDWLLVAASLRRLQAEAPAVTFPGHGRTALGAEELASLDISGPVLRAVERHVSKYDLPISRASE